ncbi:MAG: hypothetical protein ACQESF_05020 [Nanobdellota archaeon]
MADIIKQLKDEFKGNFSEILSGFFVMVLMLTLVYRIMGGMLDQVIEYLSLVALGSVIILLTGFEKRGKSFDRFVAMFLMFFLSLSFMFL